MRQAISAKAAKELDRYSIEMGMPSLVLMERAASAVAQVVKETAKACRKNAPRVLALCSVGNNGADGLAVLRILAEEGYFCAALISGDEKKATKEYLHQRRLTEKYSIPLFFTEKNFSSENFSSEKGSKAFFEEYDIIVDAIFGIGLSREITGNIRELAGLVNRLEKPVIAVDIPSGVDASTGHILGCAIKAETTVTFGYAKLGQLLYPGKEYCGKLIVQNIGFLPMEEKPEQKDGTDFADYFGEDFFSMIPVRKRRTNKGDYGKPLIIAGSRDMTGAAFLSAMAAYRTGSGVVTVLTHDSIDPYLKSILPEAIVRSYSDETVEEAAGGPVRRATVAVLGPGIGVSGVSKRLVRSVLSLSEVPVIVDADALNIISQDMTMLGTAKAPLIFTPHLGEMARLCKKDKEEIAGALPETAKNFAVSHGVYCVLKDAVTVVASPEGRVFLSTAGNPGMATAGSGDVLTGILAAVCDWKGMELYHRVCLGVQLHAMSGDRAAKKVGEHSLMARDIIDGIPEVI